MDPVPRRGKIPRVKTDSNLATCTEAIPLPLDDDDDDAYNVKKKAERTNGPGQP
jgi:hypothetical protein